VDNLGVLTWWKSGQKQGKKEKKKETHFHSLPMYIRLREALTLSLGFPLPDLIRD
jgi:hypothetical protein